MERSVNQITEKIPPDCGIVWVMGRYRVCDRREIAEIFLTRQENCVSYSFDEGSLFITGVNKVYELPRVIYLREPQGVNWAAIFSQNKYAGRKSIFLRDGYRCQYCGRIVREYKKETMQVKTPNDAATLDHILPRKEGGQSTRDNLNTSCYECNHLKADMPLEDFLNLLHSRELVSFPR